MEFDLALEVIESQYLSPFEVCELLDRRRIIRALDLFAWNQCAAAEQLKMHRNTLGRRMAELGIERPASSAKRGYRPKGMRKSIAVANGLDREMTPLAARIRLRQAMSAKWGAGVSTERPE